MQTQFYKMHGLGNDFVIFDGRIIVPSMTPMRVRALADRQTGIGCDQLIVLEPDTQADVFMRIYNADGGEVATCGNATRCVALLLHRETKLNRFAIQTSGGLVNATMAGDQPIMVQVDMGAPHYEWQAIPLAKAVDTLHLPLPGDPAATSMGNPHATFFVDDVAAHPIATLGPQLEMHTLFPERANIGFAQILDRSNMRLRVWERGAGLTLACGSGACAAAVNAYRRGLTDRQVNVILDGGRLQIDWQPNGHIFMTGPANEVFSGLIDLESLPA